MYAIASRNIRTYYVLVVGVLLMTGSWTLVQAQSLSPASVTGTVRPGDALDVAKAVHTPPIPPRPDICFLADTTGSMGDAVANVAANATTIMNMVRAVQPDSQFCAAQYRDSGDSPEFQVDQTVTASILAVQTAVNTWAPGGGGDTPEGQLHALTRLSTEAGFRPVDETVAKDQYHRLERTHGAFRRSFTLPASVDSALAQASYVDGVLTITLPRREDTKPRQIAING